jgi:hypothetical protein
MLPIRQLKALAHQAALLESRVHEHGFVSVCGLAVDPTHPVAEPQLPAYDIQPFVQP